MAKGLALLGTLALVGRLERPETPSEKVDRAIQRGLPFRSPVARPRVRPVVKVRQTGDRSNTSYAALGVRDPQPWPPEGAPDWIARPARRLEAAVGFIETLKQACRKGILAASDK
jgi:hypothetical protein